MPYDYVAVLQGKFLDNQSDSEQYYWVKLYRNGYIYQWAEVDDRTAEDGKVRVFTMTTRKDTDEEDEKSVLYDGDIITCTVMEEMHNYLEALQNDSNGPFLFSGDRCLGYFIATSPVSDSITFHPDEIPEYK